MAFTGTGAGRLAAFLATALIATSAMAQNIMFKDAPPQTPLQAKYFDYENQAGGLHCKTKSTLAELLNDPNGCYLDLDECKPGLLAVQGKADKEMVALFGDLVTHDDKGEKPSFTAACPGASGPQFTHLLGIKGVAYAKASEHLDTLLGLVKKARLPKAGQNIRTHVTDAIWMLGDKVKGAPALKDLVEFDTRNRSYKHQALQALGAWKSDVAVPYCTTALTAEKDASLVDSCVIYLGAVGAKGAYGKMIRIMEKHDDYVVRALGSLGEKKAIKVLEAYIADNEAVSRKRIAAVVSLINLGQKKWVPELEQCLKGHKPLTTKQKERAAKKAAKAKKRKKKKKAKKKKPSVDYKLIQMAAMEATRITNKKAAKKVSKALWAAAKNKDAKKWQGWVYATIALAQRGDAKAVKVLAAELENPTEKIRRAVMDTIGGRYHVPHSNFMNRGLGVVADAALLPAIYNYYDNEPKKADKTKAIHAAAHIRAMIDARK
jgi:HEAT repeat protein